MKNNILNYAAIIFSTIFLSSCMEKKGQIDHSVKTSMVMPVEVKKAQIKPKFIYTCSMHPKVRESKPGSCPICHMNLTKIEVDEEDHSSHEEIKEIVYMCKDFPEVTSASRDTCPMDGSMMVVKPDEKASQIIAKIKIRKSQIEHFSPDFFPVTKMMMNKKVRLLGSAMQSEEKESSIPARVGGRVERVYVKSTGSFVRFNDPVLDIYSPKLVTAGVEYLLARESYIKNKSKDFKEILKQTASRLELWGIKRFQYEAWFKKNKVPKNITIYSSSTGIVRKRNAIQGKYFKEGQNFFELSDLTEIWVEMDVYEHVSSLVKLGQAVELEFTSMPGEVIKAHLDFISPILDKKSRTLKVRATIKNDTGKLKPGMVANATLNIKIDGMPLVIPRNAIIDTGKRKVVWVRVNDQKYQAKVIHTGHESEGYVQVSHGLKEGEKVVVEGNFMLDAQAQLFGGYEDLSTSSKSAHSHH